MKEKEIADRYNVDTCGLREFLENRQLPHYVSFRSGLVVDDDKIDGYVSDYIKYVQSESDSFEEMYEEELKEQREEQERRIEEAARQYEKDKLKKKALANMLITSGFNFDGYTIKKYSGYISGDDAMTVSRGSSFTDGGVRDNLLASLTQIRRNALRELKEAAYELGCNAVIGVDFDYITLDPQTANITGGTTYQPYVFCVTANGNAVIIEKDEG